MWAFDTWIDSFSVLVWNSDPPKKITPAPNTTEAIRMIRVVITVPIPFRFRIVNGIEVVLVPEDLTPVSPSESGNEYVVAPTCFKHIADAHHGSRCSCFQELQLCNVTERKFTGPRGRDSDPPTAPKKPCL